MAKKDNEEFDVKDANTKEQSVLEILLDENNDSPITLFDEEDHEIKFDQVAVIPLDEKLYVILKPIEKMENVADDEAIAFLISEDENGDASLVVEDNDEIVKKVFEDYYKLVDEYEANDK